MALFSKKKNKVEEAEEVDVDVDANKKNSTFEERAREYAGKARKGGMSFINPLPVDMVMKGYRAAGKVKQTAANVGVYGVVMPAYNSYWMPVVLIWKMIVSSFSRKNKYEDDLSFLKSKTELEPFDVFLGGGISRNQLKKKGELSILLSKIALLTIVVSLLFFSVKWLVVGITFKSFLSFVCIMLFCIAVVFKEAGKYLSLYFSNNDSFATNARFLIKNKRYSEILPSKARLNSTIREYAKMKKKLERENASI